MKDQYAEVNGVRLHYVEQGKGPLILFLHGFPEFWYSWKDLLADFEIPADRLKLFLRQDLQLGATADIQCAAPSVEDTGAWSGPPW